MYNAISMTPAGSAASQVWSNSGLPPRPGTETQTLPTPGNSSQWAAQIASHRHKRWEPLSPGGLTALPSSRGLLLQARQGRPLGALSRLNMQA